MTTKTFLLELREAAQACSNVEYRWLIRGSADALEQYLDAFILNPTSDNLITLNGAWSLAARVLGNTPHEAPPAPLAGSPEPTRLAA